MSTKLCPRCKIEKPLDDFGVNRLRSDGRNSRCKPCAQINRNAVQAHIERHPERARARWLVSKALRLGKLVRPDICEKCGLKPPEIRSGVSEIHFDHCFGYSPENALKGQWICRSCHALAEVSRRKTQGRV